MQTVNDKLNKQGIQTDNINWIESVPANKQSHYWYGGEMCSIQKDDTTLTIEANGDINFRLIEKETGRELIYVKDKNGAGSLNHELNQYITNDKELIDAILEKHDTYIAILNDGNWYDCTIRKTISGEFIDSFTFDDDTLEDCIKNIENYTE